METIINYLKVIFFISVLIVSAPINLAFGCSCDEPRSPSQEYEVMDVVFSGKVINIFIDSSSVYVSKKIIIDVLDSWKGELSGRITISTAITSAECGFDFKVNSSYLVYGHSWEDSISTHMCTRTNLLEWAGADLAYLASLSSVQNQDEIQPTSVILYQNYPNPFNATTTIKFHLDKKSKAVLTLYNLQGKLVRTIINDYFHQGMNSVEFYAQNLPSGIYYYRLMANNQSIINKMLLIQ